MPLLPLALCLVLGVVIRIASHLDLAQQTKDRRRWRHLCGLKAPVAHEIFAYATERMNPEDWRQNQALLAKQLKRNKALESAKIKGLLFVSLDANEHFASFSRTCPCCCQRQVEVSASDGQKVKVIQFYHRYVFAHISGPKVNLVLDIEPILRGEEEWGVGQIRWRKPGHYAEKASASLLSDSCFQNLSNQRLSRAQRTVSKWVAPLRLHSIPDCLNLCPTTVLQAASTTPEPIK